MRHKYILILILCVLFTACNAEQEKNNEIIEVSNMKVSSLNFEDGQDIPSKYTADGDNVNPPLNIEDVPESAQSLVLIVDDPDAPSGTWTHWIVFNIDPSTTAIAENSVPGTQGMNDFMNNHYGGPAPPSGTHRYYAKVFALDVKLDLDEGASLEQVQDAMQGHVLDQAQLMGKYSRQ